MAFERKIVQELSCPRCNAWAQLRIEQEREGVCILYIVCNKCKLRKYSGVLSRKTINLMTQEEKLLKKINLMRQGKHRSQLMGKLVILRETILKERRKLGA